MYTPDTKRIGGFFDESRTPDAIYYQYHSAKEVSFCIHQNLFPLRLQESASLHCSLQESS